MIGSRMGLPPAAPHSLEIERAGLEDDPELQARPGEEPADREPGTAIRDAFDGVSNANTYMSFQSDQHWKVSPTKGPPFSASASRGWYSVSVNQYDRALGASLDENVGLDRQGGGASIDYASKTQDIGLSTWDSPGYCEVGANYSHNLPAASPMAPQVINGSTYLSGWRDFVGTGAIVSLGTHGGVTAGAGIFLGLSADRTLRYLGAYDGSCPDLAGKHWIEICDLSGSSASASLGLALGHTGVTGRCSRYDNRTTVYTTCVDPGEASARLAEGDQAGFLRNLGRALHLRAETDPLPDLRDLIARDGEVPPGALKPGDRLTVTIDGELQGSVMAGMFPLRAGALGATIGRHEITVERIAPEAPGEPCATDQVRPAPGRKLRVTVRVLDVRQLGVMATAFELFGASRTGNLSLSLERRYLMDLDVPDAERCFAALLDGVLPEGREARTAPLFPGDAARLTREVAGGEVCPGVQLDYAEKLEAPARLDHAGTIILFPFRLENPYVELGVGRRKGTERRVTSEGIIEESRVAAHRTALPWNSGLEREVVATIRDRLNAEGRRVFDALILHARLRAPAVHGDAANRFFVTELVERYRLGVEPFRRPGRGHPRVVVLEQVLRDRELRAFDRCNEAAIARAADRSGLSFETIARFVRQIRQETTRGRAERVRALVARHEDAAFQAVHALLERVPGTRGLELRTTNDAYTAPVEETQAFACAARAGLPEGSPRLIALDGASPARRVRPFYRKAARLLDAVERSLLDLEDDGLLRHASDGLERTAESRSLLEAARRQLHEMLDLKKQGFSPEERQAILSKVPLAALDSLVLRVQTAIDRVDVTDGRDHALEREVDTLVRVLAARVKEGRRPRNRFASCPATHPDGGAAETPAPGAVDSAGPSGGSSVAGRGSDAELTMLHNLALRLQAELAGRRGPTPVAQRATEAL